MIFHNDHKITYEVPLESQAVAQSQLIATCQHHPLDFLTSINSRGPPPGGPPRPPNPGGAPPGNPPGGNPGKPPGGAGPPSPAAGPPSPTGSPLPAGLLIPGPAANVGGAVPVPPGAPVPKRAEGSAGGGPSTEQETMCVPRTMVRPNVRFSSVSTSAGAAELPGADCAPLVGFLLTRRNSSVSARTRFICYIKFSVSKSQITLLSIPYQRQAFDLSAVVHRSGLSSFCN